MKQFSCGDVIPGCRRTFQGSEADILTAVAEHAAADHQLTDIPPSVVQQVRSHIVSV